MKAHENSIFLEKQLALLVGRSLSQDYGTLVELLLAVTYYTRNPPRLLQIRKQWVKAKSYLEHCTANISRDIISILAYVAEIAITFLGIPEF